MLRTLVLGISVLALLLGLCTACLAEGATLPGPNPTTPPTVPGGRPHGPGPIAVGPSLIMPSPCVVSALRVLSSLRMPMFDERLRLTDDQHKKILDIITKTEDDLKPLIQTQKKAAEEFVTGLTKGSLQEAEVHAAAAAAMKAEAAILTRKINELFAIRAALQPDQLAEFHNLVDQTTTIWRLGGLTTNAPSGQPSAAPVPTNPPIAPTPAVPLTPAAPPAKPK